MGTVHKFNRPEPKDPHLTGPCVCLACFHEWIGVVPVAANANAMECPKCHAMKGVFKEFVHYDVPLWVCEHCKGFLFTLMRPGNQPTFACATCGDQRNALDLWNR